MVAKMLANSVASPRVKYAMRLLFTRRRALQSGAAVPPCRFLALCSWPCLGNPKPPSEDDRTNKLREGRVATKSCVKSQYSLKPYFLED